MIWQGYATNGETEIFGQFLDGATGAERETDDFRISVFIGEPKTSRARPAFRKANADGTIADVDSPPDNPIDYEWRLTLPCFSTTGTCPPDVVLGTGAVDVPAIDHPPGTGRHDAIDRQAEPGEHQRIER